MSAAADVPASPFPELAELAALAHGAEREQRAQDTLFRLVIAADGDEVTRQRIRAEAIRLKVVPARLFDAIAADAARARAEGRQGAPPPSTAEAAPAPEGIREVPGSPGWAYRAADADHPGEVWEQRGNGKGWRKVLGWAPAVAGFLETPAESGNGATAYYYVIAAAGRRVTASGAELTRGEPWDLLPVAGTTAKRVREVLGNVVRAEAAEMAIGHALTHTGWHRGEQGERFYVHADGRTSDGREVVLVGREQYARLAAAASPAPELGAAKVAEAMRAVAEHAGGPGLAGLGIGVRALAHSLHRVPGGFIAVGKPHAGKSSLGWHARCVAVAKPDRADAWPPLASATFADTKTKIESALDYEADMPALVDDAALTDRPSRAEVAEVTARLEMVFRALANDTPVRGRMDRTMLPRPSNYVRSPVIATIQGTVADVPVQNSLLRRVALLPVARGEIDLRWYRKHSATLVAPLRALGEHLVIGYLAALGDAAPGYVAAKDAEARDMLAASLEAIMPGWEDDAEGLAGVADIAACALGGVLIAAEVCNLAPSALAPALLAYLAPSVAAQARRMSDAAAEATPAEALGEILRAALLDGRAHVRDHEGDASPALAGLSEQEQGLERFGDIWRGRGAPVYWLADVPALGVRAESLHKLIKASGDTRLAVRTPRTLPAYLVAEGAAVPSSQKTGAGTHQKRIGGTDGQNIRLVFLRPEILAFANATENTNARTATTATTATTQADSEESNSAGGYLSARTATLQVTDLTGASPSSATVPAPRSENASDVPRSGCSGSSGKEPLQGPQPLQEPLQEPLQARALCRGCGTRLSPWLREQRADYHVMCAPEADYAAFAASLGCAPPTDAAEAVRHLAPPAEAVVLPARAVAVLSPPSTSGASRRPPSAPASAPRRRWVVLGGDGRAYAAGGEVIELPEGGLQRCANAGELAALALALGAERCYVPRPAREALGLPASLGDPRKVTEGVPHMWTEATDPGAWDIWPGDPVGLAGWMNVYRQPRTLHEGAALVFPEWLDNAPSLAELGAPELARALELIHLATTPKGEGSGGVEFFRSPAATFARLVDKTVRHSRTGRREAVEMPPPYRRQDRRPKGAPAPLKVPGPHVAAPVEVPEGWTVARLDVRSCFASAVAGTDFGMGDAEHRQGGELTRAPGAWLVRVPALAAAHPSLLPFGAPAPGRARDAIGWLDTVAARWLAECGVPVEVIESWTWPETHRVFAEASERLGAARARLESAGGVPEAAAAAVVKSMANAFLGGRLTSDYGGDRRADDWQWRPDWWHTVRNQAEVRKQRNLLPAIASGAVAVLGELAVDSVYVAAPELALIENMPGSGGRPAVAERRGKFKIESHATVTDELSAALADRKRAGRDRLAAVKQALGED